MKFTFSCIVASRKVSGNGFERKVSTYSEEEEEKEGTAKVATGSNPQSHARLTPFPQIYMHVCI
jgi:hypothetical protein